MKIGLVGEAPNDTAAIQNLLGRKYSDIDFVTLLDRINGSMLDNRKRISRVLRIEYEEQKPDLVIFIRDLDSLEGDKKAKRKRQEIFSYSNRIVDKSGISLLNIFELEALLLADITTINTYYGTAIPTFADPMSVDMPKEVLANATRHSGNVYQESHAAVLFGLLDFDTVKKNCRYFSRFINKLEKAIAI